MRGYVVQALYLPLSLGCGSFPAVPQPDPAQILEEAADAYLADRFQKVEDLCRQALNREPRHRPFHILLHEVEYVLGHRAATQADLSRFWESKFGIGRSQGVRIVLDRAEAALDAGDFVAAGYDLAGALGSIHGIHAVDERRVLTERALVALRRLPLWTPHPW
jgi:hypothetical protein